MFSSELVLTLLALLEKAAVLATAAFLLSLVRPFQRVVTAHWSVRRTGALIVIFSVISISGSHLSVPIADLRPDLRAIGILVAGLIGGSRVGATVGLLGGTWFSFVVRGGGELWPFFLSASVLDGVLAGWVGKRTTIDRVSLGTAFAWSIAIQTTHLGVLGAILAATKPHMLPDVPARLLQVAPEVVGNAAGVTLFVLILRTAVEATAREVALSKQQAATTQARLRALQAQIRPHFLYNTLNTITYLIRTKPDEARELLARLADFYRRTLSDELTDAPLEAEIETLENYLDIERARMGDRLAIVIDASDDARRAPMPPLLLQPLVENAVRHGIAPKPEGGTVSVVARVEAGDLVVDVVDDGVGLDGTPPGVGLTNVAERIATRPRPGRLDVSGAPEGGARVRVVLPL